MLSVLPCGVYGTPHTIDMSSKIYDNSGLPYVRCAIQSVVSDLRQRLAAFVREKMKEGSLSYREIARRSRGLISHSTVADIVNERYRDISTSTLRGLARGLGVPEPDMFAIGHGRAAEAGEDPRELNLLIYFRNLPAERQADLLRIARMFNREHGAQPAEVKIINKKRRPRAA
jgi:transcriptional regulator with XRE-family HTH domain